MALVDDINPSQLTIPTPTAHPTSSSTSLLTIDLTIHNQTTPHLIMPSNSTSSTSCSIYPIDHPTLPAGLPSQEYKHHTMKSTITGAIQEIVIIESNQGTSFEISLDIKPTAYAALHQQSSAKESTNNRNNPPLREDDYLIYVLLDGINIQRSKRHRFQRTPTRISGVYSSDRSSSRSFQFGSIQLVDPDDHPHSAQDPADQICEDEKIIQALGTIQVNIVKCTLGSPQPVPRRIARANQPSHRANSNQRCAANLRTTNQMKFSERSKKACQLNTAGLSQPIPSTHNGRGGAGIPFPGKKTIRPVVHEEPNPFLQFIFRYKPRAILEAEGIIAPPPPPPPSPPRHPSEGKLKKSDTRRSSSKNSPASNTALSGQHDYQSNSELHKSSLNPNASVANERDEKKPKVQSQPVYIDIHSDSESDSRTKGDKGTMRRTTSNTTTGGLFPKPEPRDQDTRKAPGNSAIESKKRARSITVDLKPSNKRVSLGDGPSSSSTGGNASGSRAANGRHNSSQVPKTELKENIPQPTNRTTMATIKTKSGNKQYRQNVSSYAEDSSDDDDQLKTKIVAPATGSTASHSTRLAKTEHDVHEDAKKPSPQSLNHLNNKINSRRSATSSHHHNQQPQGSNFFDLTGTDDESD
ncbi:hypothetical protein PGT21_002738 [Puccinia graminis f. sp. tritici]|uniref:Uncharacterized protein n=1 Tax=Puccinia graminis f. sp. tritici TaxID=56615 RepID=A0A5B0N7Q8_PUCGR|nr:hypothetical protein PGT21_002738 [Puccinia graminis f. sp. tritici]KAA1128051.1 hypothetical protein PGTUg99_016514 [Puccinia graminis f. sp. tritici]